MTETLLMNHLFQTSKVSNDNYVPGGILNALLTVTLLTSVAGIMATVSIFATILAGNVFSKNDITALISVIVVLTGVCTLSWLGMTVAIRDARRQAANIAAILENISDGVLMLDAQGNFISANLSLLRMIPEEKLREMNAHPLEETVHWKRTVFSVRAAPVTGAGSVVIFHDETRRHETEQARDALLATASHELRAPLGSVMNYLELLLMQTETGKIDIDKFREHLQRAIENNRRLLRLVNNMLDHAQLQAGMLRLKRQVFHLPSLFEKIHPSLNELLKEKQLFYELKIVSDVPAEIRGDPRQLQKVLVNLIGNAIKFTSQGGICVWVSIPNEGTLSIEVMDTGPGIAPEHLPDIFEAFRRASNYARREHQGAGLGLAITKQIVTSMGGRISVFSVPGAGSTFKVTLPLDQDR